MPPFRNLLNRKSQPTGGTSDTIDENHLSPNQRPAPITIRKSCDGEPNEYKLSGMIANLHTPHQIGAIDVTIDGDTHAN